MVELFINGKQVDITNDIDLSLTYEMNDLSNPEAVKNSYSKTITVEGTQRNNQLFGEIYQMDKEIDNNFNPIQRVDAYIRKDGDVIDSGYIQLDSIIKKDKKIQYQLTYYGGIGDFFYNLQYDEAEEDLNLSSLYYGWEAIGKTTPMTEEEEKNNNLFEYNREFVNNCWYRRCRETGTRGDTPYIDFMQSIHSTFCPIPMYQGLYDDFTSTKILEYGTSDYIAPSYVTETNDDGSPKTTYYGYPRQGAQSGEGEQADVRAFPTEAVRDLEPFEAGDLRSHNLKLGMRLKAIYDAIKNPFNNGGYEVDDSNVDEICKKYINDGYILLPSFDFEEINDTAKYESLTFGTNTLYAGVEQGSTTITTNTEEFDISGYINPHATVTIVPSINLGTAMTAQGSNSGYVATCWIKELQCYPSRNSCSADTGYRYVVGADMIGYYLEAFDEDGNSVGYSPCYVAYGIDPDNVNDSRTVYRDNWSYETYASYSIRGAVTWKTRLIRNESTLKYSQLIRQAISAGESALSQYLPSGIVVNLTACDEDYKSNNSYWRINDGVNKSSNSEYIGRNSFAINMELPSSAVKLQVHMVNVHFRGVCHWADSSDVVTFISPENCSYLDSNYKEHYALCLWEHDNLAWYDTYGYIGSRTEDDENSICQIYDGDIAANDKRHVLDKTQLLSETNTPFDYLIGIGKMFNWVFKKDVVEKKIYIYSKYNYYDKEIIDINEDIDRDNITIQPTPIEYAKYRIGLQIPETYQSELFQKKNNKEYGIELYKPGYNFNSEENDILEDVELKMLVPYQEHSIFLSNKNGVPVAARGNRYTTTYFECSSESTVSEEGNSEEETKKGSMTIEKDGVVNTTDTNYRLCAFDEDLGYVDDCDNAFILYTGVEERDSSMHDLWLSDYYPMIGVITGEDDCYIKTHGMAVRKYTGSSETDTVIVQNHIDYLPVFNNHNSDLEISLTYDTSNSDCDNLWNLYWKNDITNIYNKNSKVLTTKMHIKENPNEMMKHYYVIDNAIWILNKVNDWNPNSSDLTEVEFIKLTDWENYCKPIYISE